MSKVKRPALPELYEKRLGRLAFFLKAGAPPHIVAGSLRICSQAYYGGAIPHIRAEIRDLIRHAWSCYVAMPFWRKLCKWNLYHLEQGPGGFGCPFCDRGVPQEVIDAMCEEEGCDVPILADPLPAGDLIYCTQCHAEGQLAIRPADLCPHIREEAS